MMKILSNRADATDGTASFLKAFVISTLATTLAINMVIVTATTIVPAIEIHKALKQLDKRIAADKENERKGYPD